MDFRKAAAGMVLLMGLAGSSVAAAEWHPAEESSSARRQEGSRADRTAEALDLTEDQRAKLQSIYKERDRKLQALYNDFRTKRNAVKEESDAKVDALLTPEQREKRKSQRRKSLVGRAKTLEEKGLKKN